MGLMEDLAAKRAEGRIFPPVDESVQNKCPLLWEMLTMDRWSDGRRRVLPRILIDRVSGGYLVTLQDDSIMARKTGHLSAPG